MDYRYVLAALPSIVFGIFLGAYCLTLVRLSRARARLRREEANLMRVISDLEA